MNGDLGAADAARFNVGALRPACGPTAIRYWIEAATRVEAFTLPDSHADERPCADLLSDMRSANKPLTQTGFAAVCARGMHGRPASWEARFGLVDYWLDSGHWLLRDAPRQAIRRRDFLARSLFSPVLRKAHSGVTLVAPTATQ